MGTTVEETGNQDENQKRQGKEQGKRANPGGHGSGPPSQFGDGDKLVAPRLQTSDNLGQRPHGLAAVAPPVVQQDNGARPAAIQRVIYKIPGLGRPAVPGAEAPAHGLKSSVPHLGPQEQAAVAVGGSEEPGVLTAGTEDGGLSAVYLPVYSPGTQPEEIPVVPRVVSQLLAITRLLACKLRVSLDVIPFQEEGGMNP